MVLRLVEVKSNNLYVLYDADGKGVCCCTKYTINQLLNDYNQTIDGVTKTPSGLKIQEV